MSSQASKAVAAAEGLRVWNLYGFKTPTDLVLEDLAFAMGVLVVCGRLENCDARLLRKGERGLIRVSDAISEPGRRRFAIAHELGHWELHKNVSQAVACTSEDMVKKYKASPEEVEANYFASSLLMPEPLFGPRCDGKRPSVELVRTLADEFGTSLTATAIRIVELSQDYCAVVFSENGRVRWFRASEAFEGAFWQDPGSRLPATSVVQSGWTFPCG
jgi:Zn-dependent peptidase ImmA (M78 family)